MNVNVPSVREALDISTALTVGQRELRQIFLHMLGNVRRVFVYGPDAQRLFEICDEHGYAEMGSDVEHSLQWLIHHLFTGACFGSDTSTIVRQNNDGLARGSCRTVASDMKGGHEIVSFLLDLVITRTSFVSTESLFRISRVFQDVLDSEERDRPALLRVLRDARDSLRTDGEMDFNLSCLLFERHGKRRMQMLCREHGLDTLLTCDAMKDTLVSHLCHGECALRENLGNVGCVRQVDKYGMDRINGNQVQLQNLYLTEMRALLKPRGLRKIIRALDPGAPQPRTTSAVKRTLNKYIDNLHREIQHVQAQVEPVDIISWPELIPFSRKIELLRSFQVRTSSSVLRKIVCASCGELCDNFETSAMGFNEFDISLLKRPDRREHNGTVIDAGWLNGCSNHPVWPGNGDLCDILYDPKGLVLENQAAPAFTFCQPCKRSLQKGKTPELAIANHIFLGDVPPELSDLTVVEEAMIARCRAKSCIIHLRDGDGVQLGAQRALRGHVVIFPQEPGAILDLLPPSIETLTTFICVVFVGSQPPTAAWLRQHAYPLLIRKEKVQRALQWLRAHNSFYQNVSLNSAVLSSLEEVSILPAHIEVVDCSVSQEELTSSYDPIRCNSPERTTAESTVDVFHSVVVANVKPESPPSLLRAAALEHVFQKGKDFVQFPHGRAPVGDINNPGLFPMVYPTLFPYGLGGSEDRLRQHHISLHRQVKHFLLLADRRFQTHFSFIFTAFNLIQRRKILIQSSVKMKRSTFNALKARFAAVSPAAIHTIGERVAKGDFSTTFTSEEQQVRDLLNQVSHVTSHVPGSNSVRLSMRNEIRGLIFSHGLPTFYVTINPADVYSPVLKFLAQRDFDIDNMKTDDIPSFWTQAQMVANNPVVCAQFFRLYINAFFECLLATDKPNSQGIFGRISAYYGSVEAQGRGSLHCHMLIWVAGNVDPDEIHRRVVDAKDEEFRQRLLSFLDDTISSRIPDEVLQGDQVASELNHPCSVRFPSLEGNEEDVRQQLQKDLHFLVRACQVHRHTATCFKYWHGPSDQRVCRFGLSEENVRPESELDPTTGVLSLRIQDGMVNQYNDVILSAMRCNMDIKFIGSGATAKAILYYITDYITKTQLKVHVTYAALEAAVSKIGPYDPAVDDLTLRAKKLLQKCAYALISHQELSAQQVSSYLLGYDDRFTDHIFRNLYWTAFDKFLREEEGASQRNFDDADVEGNQDHTEILERAFNADGLGLLDIDSQGDLILRSSNVDDYRYRPIELDGISLWEHFAQVEKVPMTRRTKSKDDSDTSETDSDSLQVQENVVSDCLNILSDCSTRRPKFRLQRIHPDYHTSLMRVRSPSRRFTPVPVGAALPRRDRSDSKEEYSRAMLLLFKPWRNFRDLRPSGSTWPEAFSQWELLLDPHDRRVEYISNIRKLQECRDARDRDMASRNQPQNDCPGVVSSIEIEENDLTPLSNVHFMGTSDEVDHEEECVASTNDVVDYILRKNNRLQDDCLVCLHHLEQSGCLGVSSSSVMTGTEYSSIDLDRQCHQILQGERLLEDEWANEYEKRRERSKHPPTAANDSTNFPQQFFDFRARPAIVSLSLDERSTIAPSSDESPLVVRNLTQHGCIVQEALHQVAVDIAEKFSLNSAQRRAFFIITNHSRETNPEPLRMYIGGVGGTGKSRVIHAVKEYFDTVGQPNRFRLSSFTGVAASNIGGVTLHSALALGQRHSKSSQQRNNPELAGSWQGVDYLFIDELSTIGNTFMTSVSEGLSIAKGNSFPFGKISVIFAGDFGQLPPVGQKSLYAHLTFQHASDENSQRQLFGKLLWYSVDVVVMLTEVKRQVGSETAPFIDLLQRLRIGKCTMEDFNKLQQRILGTAEIESNDPLWHDAPIIVSNNAIKDLLNNAGAQAFATRSENQLHWYYSSDLVKGEPVDQSLSSSLQKLHSGETNFRLGRLPLVIGMPVMIGHNFEVESGIVNGCTGKLISIRYTVDTHGHRHAVSCVVEAPSIRGDILPHLEVHQAVVLEDTVDITLYHPYMKHSFKFKRKQLPLLPGFAMTCHKAQGLTMPRAILDLEGCIGSEAPYVMLSRVKSLQGVLILRPFAFKRITSRQSEDARKEEKRLQILHLLTTVKYGSSPDKSAAQTSLEKLSHSGSTSSVCVPSSLLDGGIQASTGDARLAALHNIESSIQTGDIAQPPPPSLHKKPLKRVLEPSSDPSGSQSKRLRLL